MTGTNSSSDVPLLEPRRRRPQTRLFLFLGIAMLLVGIGVGIAYVATRPVTLRIAVGPEDGDDRALIKSVAASFAHDRSPVRLSLIATSGKPESIALLSASRADIAVVRGDLDLPHDARALAILRKDFAVLWAPGKNRRGSETKVRPRIKQIDDLAGRHIGLVGPSAADLKMLQLILREAGVVADKVKVTQFAPDQIGQMAHDPALDAFMTIAPLDGRTTTEALALTASIRGEPTFLPIDTSEAIAHKHPLYASDEIPASSFGAKPARPDEAVETISVHHLLVARSSLPDSAAGAFTRQLLTARQSLIPDHPEASRIEKPETDKDAALPAHPGAAAYVDGTERTFLEQYSDYFWAGILLMSVVGSAGAWFAHYLKRDEKNLNTLHRDRLLITIAGVREARSLQELATLQGNADAVLRETLDCYDDGAIDEGDLMAFDLVLTQFHHAIVERRTELGADLPEALRLRVR